VLPALPVLLRFTPSAVVYFITDVEYLLYVLFFPQRSHKISWTDHDPLNLYMIVIVVEVKLLHPL